MAERADLTVSDRRETTTDASRSAENIRQDIAARREAISNTMDRLGDKVEQTFDWRTYVSDYPIIALGVAAGFGMLVSRAFRAKPSPGERVLEALADGIEDVTWQLRSNITELTGKKKGVRAAVKAAAAAWATKALTEYLKGRVGGFSNQDDEASQNQKQERIADRQQMANPDNTISSRV